MTEKNKKEEQKSDSIPQEIIDSISSLEPEALYRSDSCPPCFKESFDISEMLDESKKKEKEKDYKIGNYLIKRTLGQGTFGKVKLGIYLPSQEKVAIKILEKDRIVERDDEIRVKREFDMLALFNHPNVILVAEIFESPNAFFSVMEYCEGGELFNFIVKNRRLSEDEAAYFYYQLINGLEYLHSLGIVHRDLKPENLLLTKDHLLKIIDFGLSNYFHKGQKELLVTPCGSPCYASPEMVAGKKYNGFKIDIWSTGIILYAMLCGYLPFEDKDNELLFEKILECKLEFPRYITKNSKDLIEKILVTDPDKRIGIPEIKNHPFFIRGKELFEQEFSICQNEVDEKELNVDIDINNILDTPLLKDEENIVVKDEKPKEKSKNEIKEKEKEKEKNNKEKEKEKEKNKEKRKGMHTDKRRNKHKKISLKDIDQENVLQRLNTDFDENIANLRNAILNDFKKDDEKKETRKRNSSSVRKNGNRNNRHNINIVNNKNSAKKKGPFKRDIVLLKNNTKYNEKNKLLKKDKKLNKRIKSKDFRNNKKLIKTNKYNNITKPLGRKRNAGNSVNLRNLNYKRKYNKNVVSKRINYTNIIKNKFNSKENIKKNENIYINNINNTIDEESLSNKKYLNHYDFKLYNEKKPKKTRSVAKKNAKMAETENRKNKKFLYNLFTINNSIKKYKNKLNSGNNNPKNNKNPIGLKYNLLDKSYNASLDIDNMMANNQNKENKSRIRTNREKIKFPVIKISSINNSNENINIIDNTEDENNSNDYGNKVNITEKTENSKKKISPKNVVINFKGNKDKFIKKSIKRLNHVRLLKLNSNFHNNQENIKINYYLNEIYQKKTIDPDNYNYKIHKIGNITENLDNSYNKKKHFNIKNENKNKSINYRTEYLGKEKKGSMRKKKLIINSNIIKQNSGLAAIENALRTEPNKSINPNIKKGNKYNINEKSDKKKFYSKKITTANTNNLNPKNKNPKNNYSKNLNKTTNNFTYNSINNSSNKNPFNNNHNNILELINTSSSNYNNTASNNNNANKKNSNRKSSQVIQNNNNNNKKPCVTIKNTVINLNIDTGIILSSIDKKRKAKKINSKRGTNNSISQINNNQIYNLDSKYNKYLTNDEIDHLNRSTNENYPLKTKSIKMNENYNLISLNDDIANNNIEIINKNSNFQKIYVYGDKTSYKKNLKPNNAKENKNDNNKSNTKNASSDKRHGKFKSMKLDDYYSMKGRKREEKDTFIDNNEL